MSFVTFVGKLTRAGIAVGLLSVGLASPVLAAQRTAVFGRDGEVFKVRVGTYGTLFPMGKAAPKDNPVLAVDRARPDLSTVRILVPDSIGSEQDREPSLFFEDASGYLFLVWESIVAPGLAQLSLARFDGSSWSPAIQISGPPSAMNGKPQLAMSRTEYLPDARQPARVVTTLHLVWWEESSSSEAAYYSPLVFEDGVYLGWNPIFRLNDLDRSVYAEEGDTMSRALFRSPAIDAGRDASSVVLGFANPRTARMVSLELVALPAELGRLADEVRTRIIAGGSYDLDVVADDARSHIIGYGSGLHPSVSTFLADAVAARVRAAVGLSALDLGQLANDARSHIIGYGAETLLSGRETSASAVGVRVIEMPASRDSGLPSHLFALRAVKARPIPVVPDTSVTVRLSPDGSDALLTWFAADRLVYRESRGDGWSEVIVPNLPRSLESDPEQLLIERLRF